MGFVLLLLGMFYLVYWLPMQEGKRKQDKFENRVLGTIEGLYLSDLCEYSMPGVYLPDLISFTTKQLHDAELRPATEPSLRYEASNGRCYTVYTTDAALFAVICVCMYARAERRYEMKHQYEGKLEEARRLGLPPF